MSKIKTFLTSRLGITLLSLCIFFLITTLSYNYFSTSDTSSLQMDTTPIDLPEPDPPEDLKTLNVIFLGYGGAGHEGGYLTDAITLVHLDFDQSLLALISIPRDLWVQFPDGNSRKINAAFALGSQTYPQADLDPKEAESRSTAIKSAFSTVTNLPINYFVAVDFVGFQRAIGSIGGIDVNVTETLDDPWYPTRGKELELCDHTPEETTQLTATYSGFELEKQFPCRYEHVYYEPGMAHMEGGDALKFVRSRHSSSDFARGLRQQQVILGLKDKLFSLNALDDIPTFTKQLFTHLHTDIDTDILEYAAPALKSVTDFKVIHISLSPQNVLQSGKANAGAYILYPQAGFEQWDQVHDYIQTELNSQEAPTSTP